MFKIIFKRVYIIVVVIFTLSIPSVVFGADVFFELLPQTTVEDQTAVVGVRIDSKSVPLNVVEGVIVFEGELRDQLSVEVETGGSILHMWPTRPEYLPQEKAIRFTGGAPGGFIQGGLLFRMRLFSPVSGNVKINWVHGASYRNDGNGTKEPIFARSISLYLAARDKDIVRPFSADKNPPTFEPVRVGRDDSVHEGKYFISFNAQDDMSGVDRYEIQEGEVKTTLRDGVYVLQDQTRATPVFITAYDKAGNSSVTKVSAKINWQRYSILFIIILAVVFALYVYKKTKK